MKKERWLEGDVLQLPPGEHDYFDRKSGALLGESDVRTKVAKALSAFANSGGGHLLIGVRDDGTFDGVPPMRGKTSTREWLEQVIPDLLDYSISDFRVHEVEPARPSGIPIGSVVIVIDVGDSTLAPHQSKSDKLYYRREGGHSKPAPNFYIEMLRSRLLGAALRPAFIGIRVFNSYVVEPGLYVEAAFVFSVTNGGRVAAYKWRLVASVPDSVPTRGQFYFDSSSPYRRPGGRSSSSRLDSTILPSLSLEETCRFEMLLPRTQATSESVKRGLISAFEQFVIGMRAVSETSPGEEQRILVLPLLPLNELTGDIILKFSSDDL